MPFVFESVYQAFVSFRFNDQSPAFQIDAVKAISMDLTALFPLLPTC